jgi:hypothetical protein
MESSESERKSRETDPEVSRNSEPFLAETWKKPEVQQAPTQARAHDSRLLAAWRRFDVELDVAHFKSVLRYCRLGHPLAGVAEK